MAVFQVPQFVEQKAKIIGSLTIAQFGYLAAAGLIVYGLYYIFNFFVWVLVSLPIAALGAFLAFAKVNGQESYKVLGSVFGFLTGSKTYVWQRKTAETETTLKIGEKDHVEVMRGIMGAADRIKSIALKVTTGKIFENKPFGAAQGKKGEKESMEIATFETGEKKLVKRVDYS